MTILLMKLIGAPLFLVLATLAARRWGETVGGLIIALPCVSGPISVFLAIENGAAFAVNSGYGSLAGTTALTFFGMTYALVCPKGRILAVVLGLSAFTIVSFLVAKLGLSLWPLFILTAFCIVFFGWKLPISKSDGAKATPVKHDLLLRALFMVTLTLAVTLSAPYIGPAASGILSSLPLMALTMALFAQRGGKNASEAQKVMKGLVSGLLSTAVFYLVLPYLLHDGALFLGYTEAVVASLLTQCVVLLFMRHKHLF